MRWLTLSVLVVFLTPALRAHFPDRANEPVHPRVDVIGPLGTCLPISHRRRYNRPSKIMGVISYYIAPSSQEAMAWHSAKHRHLYENHRPRIEQHFFYPKPWEGLRIGPRVSTTSVGESIITDGEAATSNGEATGENQALHDPQDGSEDLIVRTTDDPIVSDYEFIEL